jgi:hypothetical protein
MFSEISTLQLQGGLRLTKPKLRIRLSTVHFRYLIYVQTVMPYRHHEKQRSAGFPFSRLRAETPHSGVQARE